LNGIFQEHLTIGWVIVLFFCIGYTMFLLPPVPGIPVYITSGIILPSQARNMSLGYYGGIALAVGLSVVLKLSAVAGQYSIGFFMGKSVKIQQLVAVDKVFTRAIEKILMRKGLDVGKVSVLVGGPDWPTSVLCGILRLNLFQCILGTVPVILVSSPCVLAGAFMVGPRDKLSSSEEGTWSTLATTALAMSGMVQMLSGVLAIYFIQKVMSSSQEELQEPRPDHEAVLQLTLAEQDFNQSYAEALEWRALPKVGRVNILLSVLLMLMSLFMFVFLSELCFEPFQVRQD